MSEPRANRVNRLRRLRADNPGYSTAKNRTWQMANPEKRRAHKIVETAVRKGELMRSPCERCGDTRSQAHHDDYSNPLKVMWLCQLHHRERHRELECMSSASSAGNDMPASSLTSPPTVLNTPPGAFSAAETSIAAPSLSAIHGAR